jgi:membrane dipeptidase
MINDMNAIPPIIDGHNDTFLRIFKPEPGKERSFLIESQKGHIDLPRARKGRLSGGIFSLFTPPPSSSPESDPQFGLNQLRLKSEIAYSAIDAAYACDFTDSLLGFALNLEKQSDGQVKIIQNNADLKACLNNHILAVILLLEGAEAVKQDLSNLADYYRKGIRLIGLCWSRPNAFGYGVPFKFPRSPDTGPGLTRSGKYLIKACNRIGITVDLSHLNQSGFFDVAGISEAPLVVTHSNVYTLCRSSRNLTDEQLRAIAGSNGIIGISFMTENITADGRPDPDLPLSSIVNQIDYVAQKFGIDHVAIGSDFDGSDMPECISDVTKLPDLIQALRSRGYDLESLEKITYRNWLRVFEATWKE